MMNIWENKYVVAELEFIPEGYKITKILTPVMSCPEAANISADQIIGKTYIQGPIPRPNVTTLVMREEDALKNLNKTLERFFQTCVDDDL